MLTAAATETPRSAAYTRTPRMISASIRKCMSSFTLPVVPHWYRIGKGRGSVAGFDKTAYELQIIAERLRAAGETELRSALLKAVTGAVRPVGDEIRAGLGDHMPGRYAAELDADLRISTTTRLAGDDPVVGLRGTPRSARNRALRRLEGGVLGHPVFGIRNKSNPRMWAAWSYQEDGVTAGFFSGPAERAAPQVRDAIERALGDVAANAARKGP